MNIVQDNRLCSGALIITLVFLGKPTYAQTCQEDFAIDPTTCVNLNESSGTKTRSQSSVSTNPSTAITSTP